MELATDKGGRLFQHRPLLTSTANSSVTSTWLKKAFYVKNLGRLQALCIVEWLSGVPTENLAHYVTHMLEVSGLNHE